MTRRLACAGLLLLPAACIGQPLDKDHAAKMARGLDEFARHVRPLFVEQCLKCHGGDKTEGEFDLTDRDRLLKGGAAGPAVVSGDPAKSVLYRMMTGDKKPLMPYKGAKLPDDAIKHVAAWIESGAPYDKPLVECADATAWTKKNIHAAARDHWAFRPLKPVAPPDVKSPGWVKTPVDRFVLAKLEAAQIVPNGPAEKRVLARRAYLDLIGLPPTPEQLDAFVKDEAPDAVGRLIDAFLASPHYGERWGRHWLDLVRFAESHGFEHDYDRPTAYHYRDFVIKALNDDLPFDTFVKWQLAGDEIAPANAEALMATGFLAAGVHSTQITKNEVEKHRYDELDDMLATTGDGHARPDGRLRPLPRPQVRRHPAGRLLPHAGDVHHDRAFGNRPRHSTPRATARPRPPSTRNTPRSPTPSRSSRRSNCPLGSRPGRRPGRRTRRPRAGSCPRSLRCVRQAARR